MLDPVQPDPDSFPAPQRRSPGGSIRWAVGSPESPRSQSWLITGSRTDEVYLRAPVGHRVIKLSLHRSDRWRMAWTDGYAESMACTRVRIGCSAGGSP